MCIRDSQWSGRRGSNSLPPPWQGGALPDELRPHIRCIFPCTLPSLSLIHISWASGAPGCSTDRRQNAGHNKTCHPGGRCPRHLQSQFPALCQQGKARQNAADVGSALPGGKFYWDLHFASYRWNSPVRRSPMGMTSQNTHPVSYTHLGNPSGFPNMRP